MWTNHGKPRSNLKRMLSLISDGENKKMDDAMKAYWDKAVAYVETGDGHPGKLINQSFVHQRINKFHEVKFMLSIFF